MIVVTGATGNVGRPLLEALAAEEQVLAVSRRPPTGGLPAGVRHRQADLADPESLRPAFEGASAVFLIVAGDRAGDLVDVVKAGGVTQLVLLSSQGAATRPEAYPHPREFEATVMQSGLDWTILRPGGFDSNALMWAPTIRAARTVTAPFGDVGLPWIHPADIADVAATVLRDRGHAGRIYELTGPERISPREQTQEISDALGARILFVEQSRDEARAQMVNFMPESVVDATLSIIGEPTAAEQSVSPDVEQILGRAPRSFAEWAHQNIAAFA